MRRLVRSLFPKSYFLIPRLGSRSGFTILELLIFSAIFTLASVAFIGILASVSRVQVRQGSAAEVTTQSQFLLQTIQRLVEQSSVVEMAANAPTSTLKLRMASSSADPTYVYLSSSTVYLKATDSGVPEQLTSGRLSVTDLTFTKRANAGGHDSVSVSFTLAYNTANIQQRFSQSLDTAIARVSAATFDSNIVPTAGNTFQLGVAAQDWQSINSTIYFSGGNVGIGVASPGQTLEINGGMRLNTTAGQPSCSASERGTFWVVQSGSGVKDFAQVCVKNASDTYLWAPLY